MKEQQSEIHQVRLTEAGKSYWEGNGAYQKEYDELYEKLVPARGCAETVAGEMIRGVSRLYYDYFNNGNDNVADVQYDDDDYIESVKIDGYYQKFFDLLRKVYTRIHEIKEEEEVMEKAFENLRKIENIIIECGKQTHSFSSVAETTYNNMADYCMYVVMKYQNLASEKMPSEYRD